jgi:WhiB family redox-sensing transcriptional regulator
VIEHTPGHYDGCTCIDCCSARRRVAYRRRAYRPAVTTEPAATAIITTLLNRGWTRSRIAGALRINPAQLRAEREELTVRRNYDRLERLLDVSMLTDHVTPDWHEVAACKGLPTAVFFPGVGETTTRAVSVCEGCPVRLECYATAVLWGEEGVWGGYNFTRKETAEQAA